jgi:hypothetical protein
MSGAVRRSIISWLHAPPSVHSEESNIQLIGLSAPDNFALAPLRKCKATIRQTKDVERLRVTNVRQPVFSFFAFASRKWRSKDRLA